MIKNYKRKIVEIKAYQWFINTDTADVELLKEPQIIGDMKFVGKIIKNNCSILVKEGDYIVFEQENEIKVIPELIFNERYELIDVK